METPFVYELRHPRTVEPGKRYPAIFCLHGMGSNEQDILSLVNGFENQFFIFSIRGPIVQPPGFAYFTIQGYGKPHRAVFDQAVSQIKDFIQDACEEYPLDHSRLYMIGFSQGAILSMTVGANIGNKLRGIVALSGYIPGFVKEEYTIAPMDQLHLFISHGEMDSVLPYEWGMENVEFFKKAGASVTFHDYPIGHTVSQQNLNDFRQWIQADLNSNG